MPITEDATITSKGQVTIPKRIRDRLGLDAGTEIEFILDDDGTMQVRPKEPAMERLRAIKTQLAPHDVDVEAMREYEYIDSAPLIDEVAEEAAALRDTYSEPGERERSYADAIHLATAIRYDECDALYAGDPDSDGIDEIETVVSCHDTPRRAW